MFGRSTKIKTGGASDSVHSHNIPEKEVEKAAQLLALFVKESNCDEGEIELRNLSCEHGKVGDFRITIEKI